MTSPCSICIVDDSDDYCFLVKSFFRRQYPTCSTHAFSSGQALLKQLPDIDPPIGLILLDRHMPYLDGHQTLVLLKQESAYRMIPVVIVSADATTEEIRALYMAGANSFILKGDARFTSIDALSLVSSYWLNLNQRAG